MDFLKTFGIRPGFSLTGAGTAITLLRTARGIRPSGSVEKKMHFSVPRCQIPVVCAPAYEFNQELLGPTRQQVVSHTSGMVLVARLPSGVRCRPLARQ